MIFNKELDQISETDLRELIDNNVEESLILDYKRELTSSKEIAKDVSSMANAKGGFLIYGIGEDESRRATKLVGIESKATKEKVENIVLSTIQPRLDVDIHPVNLTTDPSKIALVLRIPESSRAPHMVTAEHDNRYYRRRNFQAQIMEESEVTELYRRMEDMSRKVDDFLASKGNGLLDPNQNGEPWVSVLVSPTILQDDLVKIDRPTMEYIRAQKALYLADIDYFWTEVQPSIEGFECVRLEPDTRAFWRIFEVNRNGCIQMARELHSHSTDKKLQSLPLAILLANTLRIAWKVFERVGYLGNVKIIMGVNNIFQFELEGNPTIPRRPGQTPLGRRFLRVVRERYAGILASQTETVAKDMIDQIYNGFGRLESDLFGPDGKLVVPRY
jgi:hypothetical protein